MILQCKNCKRWYKGKYKLRRHYLTYLPFYFGSFICTLCEISFETKSKLVSHIIKKRHKKDQEPSFDVKLKRQEYFNKTENKSFGSCNIPFEESDISYLLNSKGVTNFDIEPVVDTVLNLDQKELHTSNTMELNNKSLPSSYYETVTPELNMPTQFEENVLKSDSYLPPPPVMRSAAKRKSATISRPPNDMSLDILAQQVQNLEFKITNLEETVRGDIQSAKEDILAKLDQSMGYERQLYQAVSTQFREAIIEVLSKSLQGMIVTLNSLGVQSPSGRH